MITFALSAALSRFAGAGGATDNGLRGFVSTVARETPVNWAAVLVGVPAVSLRVAVSELEASRRTRPWDTPGTHHTQQEPSLTNTAVDRTRCKQTLSIKTTTCRYPLNRSHKASASAPTRGSMNVVSIERNKSDSARSRRCSDKNRAGSILLFAVIWINTVVRGHLVHLGELVAGAGQADFQALGFAEPTVGFGFCDAGLEVVVDLGEAATLVGVGSQQGAAQAAVFVDAGCVVGTAAVADSDLRRSKWPRNSVHSSSLGVRYSSLGRSSRRRAMNAR